MHKYRFIIHPNLCQCGLLVSRSSRSDKFAPKVLIDKKPATVCRDNLHCHRPADVFVVVVGKHPSTHDRLSEYLYKAPHEQPTLVQFTLWGRTNDTRRQFTSICIRRWWSPSSSSSFAADTFTCARVHTFAPITRASRIAIQQIIMPRPLHCTYM